MLLNISWNYCTYKSDCLGKIRIISCGITKILVFLIAFHLKYIIFEDKFSFNDITTYNILCNLKSKIKSYANLHLSGRNNNKIIIINKFLKSIHECSYEFSNWNYTNIHSQSSRNVKDLCHVLCNLQIMNTVYSVILYTANITLSFKIIENNNYCFLRK